MMPQDRRLRVAIVGAGLMGHWHADAARRAGAVVTLVADSSLERAQRLARKSGAKAARVIDEDFAVATADVVHVCTPPDDHERVIRAALDAGQHVLGEKPLAATTAITADLYSLAAARGVLLCPVHQFLFQPGMLALFESRHSMGSIRHIAASICSAGADSGDGPDRDRLAFNILSHPLSLIAATLPQALDGLGWHTTRSAPGEIQAVGSADGAAVAILISTHGRPPRNSFCVTADQATWHADLFHGFAFREDGNASRLSKVTRPFAVAGRTLAAAAGNAARRTMSGEVAFPGLRELVSRFYSAVISGGPPPITVSDTLDVAAARDTIIAGLRLNGALA